MFVIKHLAQQKEEEGRMRFGRSSPLTPSPHHQHRHHNRPASLLLLLLALCGCVVIHTTVWRTSRETESAVNCHPTATIASPSSSFAKSGNKTNDTGRRGVITIPGIPAAGTRHDDDHPQQHRVLIVTLSTGDGADAYATALQNQAAYARCHNYDFLNYNATTTMDDQKVHPFMQKAFALRSILSNTDNAGYHHVLWIDRDAIFMNHDISIAKRLQEMMNDDTDDGFDEDDQHHNNNNNGLSSLHKSYDLFVAVETWAWWNGGVLLFRNTPFRSTTRSTIGYTFTNRVPKIITTAYRKFTLAANPKPLPTCFHCNGTVRIKERSLRCWRGMMRVRNGIQIDSMDWACPICYTRVMMNGPTSRHLYSLIRNTKRRSRLWPNNGSILIHGIKKSTKKTKR
jgi:hypothetical protein